jgi:uroporphyrinogen-III synthase
MPSTRVILTRPDPQAQGWETALTEAGFEVALLPLIHISLLPPPAALPDLSACHAVFLVSRNALDGLIAWYGLAALQNAAVRWLCPGAGTAQQLVSLGIAAQRIVQPALHAPQDSWHLWQTLQAHAPLQSGQNLLVVKGCDAGLSAAPQNWFATQALGSGCSVEEIISYQRQAPDLTVAQAELAQSAAQDGSVWLFSSSLAIAHLRQALPEIDFKGTPCIATHERIGQTAQQHGFQARICQPLLNDIANALRQAKSA